MKENNIQLNLLDLFKNQVDKSPDKTALIFKEKSYTYKEIDLISDKIANYISQTHNIKAGESIALFLEKSEWAIITIIAIQKLNAVYVPININFPTKLIDYIVKDAQVSLLITNSIYLDSLVNYTNSLVLIDVEYEILPDTENFKSKESGTDDLAYIIYTSGTTGRPKGVAIRHSGICNTLNWRKKYYGFKDTDCFLQIPSFSFDSSILDIFTALSSGASLLIPEENRKTDLKYLYILIEKYPVSHFLITPTFYSYFLKSINNRINTKLRIITVAGEKLHKSLVDEHYEKLPGVDLVNEYGPTENSVCSSAMYMKEDDKTITIGKQIYNTEIYILDKDLNVVKKGEIGEICLAGIGLSPGYINSETLNKEKFLENPFNKKEKIYRTGDLGRVIENDEIEFIGRLDNQVKIRGFRVELAEIEKVLLGLPEISNGLVFVESEGENKILVACCVLQSHCELDELRNKLATELPDYMIPSKFIFLDEIPMNEHNKADISKIKELGESKETLDLTKPINELEKIILEIFSTVYVSEAFGRDTNIFDRGANSLNIIQVGSLLYEKTSVEIPGPEIYQYPTAKKLAGLLKKKYSHKILIK